MVGPSGCGKTLLAGTLAKMLNVPFVITDATGITETGYVGDNVESCLQRLLELADGDLELAQKGIVYIDEIDKIARDGNTRSDNRDVSREGVQMGLLKMIEGCEVSLPVNGKGKHSMSGQVTFNTADVLFICGGAFEGLFDTDVQNNPIGFISSEQKIQDEMNSVLNSKTLVNYGMLPELVGRLPILCALSELNESDLVRILTEPEDAITKEYELLFEKDGVVLTYEDDALKEIARMAIEKNTGARELRTILEDVMLDIMYDLPNRKDISECIMTRESLSTKEPALIPIKNKKTAAAH